ncbi:MAG: amidase, partial [Ilumatobacteraceae bacterium]
MPDADLDLAYLSATDALAMFRARTLSPVELLDALIGRIESVEPVINAVVDERLDEARIEAKASADRYAGGEARPLDGLPVAAKEEHPITGRSWTQGSHVYAQTVADLDHPVIERIHEAGGIVHVRTATPEFCCTGFCHSTMWGITRNPWATDWSPGGSSGGSGAALAAGYAPLATGSDIGGSIRIPSSLSGVVGFKPPFGRVPSLPPYNLDQFCHDGPMARTIADLALIENVLAGPHWRDVASLRFPPTVPQRPEGVAGLRIALCLRLGEWPLAPEVEANTRRVADALEAAGAEVEEVELPWTLEAIWHAAQAHFAGIMGAGVAAVDAQHGDVLNDYTRAFAA